MAALESRVSTCLLGTFGWNPKPKAIEMNKIKRVENHDFFENLKETDFGEEKESIIAVCKARIEFPGIPKVLKEKIDTLEIKKFTKKINVLKYDRPPFEALMLAAEHYHVNTSSFDFISPRRNLLNFLGKKGDFIDVYRSKEGPIVIDRVINYDSLNMGDIGPQVENLWTESDEKTSNQFRALCKVEFGSFSILMSAEVDAVSKSYFNFDYSDNESRMACFREIKQMKSDNSYLKKLRAPKQYLQSALIGISALNFGWTRSVESIESNDIFEVVPENLDVNSLLSQKKMQQIQEEFELYLTWVKENTPDEFNKKCRLDYHDKSVKYL